MSHRNRSSSSTSDVPARCRHHFGWSLQLHVCADCYRTTRNRGCGSCCERLCKDCFAQHTCEEAPITSTVRRHTLEATEGIDVANGTMETTEQQDVRPPSASMDGLGKLLDDWDAQCLHERLNDTCNRASDLLHHATQLHEQHGEVFEDILARAHACHLLLQNGFGENSQTSEASVTVVDIESEIDELSDELIEIERRKPLDTTMDTTMRSHVSDASTRASTHDCSTASNQRAYVAQPASSLL